MVRNSAILLLILAAVLATIPNVPQTHGPLSSVHAGIRDTPLADPNATLYALNYTYAQADLYTKASPSFRGANPALPSSTPPYNFSTITWLNTVTQTNSSLGPFVQGSGFLYNLTKTNLQINATRYQEMVSWNVTVPKYNCVDCTSTVVAFNFNGTLTKGANANYTLCCKAGGSYIQSQNFTNPGAFGPSAVSLSGCPAGWCADVTSYTGSNLTITFRFGWNSTETGLKAEEGELTVAAVDNTLKPAYTNSMVQGSDPTKVIHTTSFRNIAYNASVSYKNSKGVTVLHVWNMEILNLYYPSGYNVTRAALNSTTVPRPGQVPFEQDACNPFDPRCATSILAFNLTDFTAPKTYLHNSTLTITSQTFNAISQLNPLSNGVQSSVFAPGDTLSVKAVIKPTDVNLTQSLQQGRLNITFTDPSGAQRSLPGQTLPLGTATGGVYNFTLPSDCSNNSCGHWSLSGNFTSGFDLGIKSNRFTIDSLQVKSFSSSNSGVTINAQGTLGYTYSTTTPVGVPVMVFAIDSGTQSNLPLLPTTNSSNGPGLYVSNATLVNGVFTQGQSLIMIFTIANNTSQSVNATVRIEHEWPGSPPQTHGVFANFTIGAANDGLGDLPFTKGSAGQTYQATITLTTNGVQVALAGARTPQNKLTKTMSLGASPVVSTEQHSGLFKITVATWSGSSLVGTNVLESPPYAYVPGGSVLGISLAPSRYLAHSNSVNTDSNAGFSVTLNSTSILAAKKLVLFALARDAAGVVVDNTGNSPGFSDSTILQSSMDSIGQVAESQTVTATLHLTNNSTKITAVINVDLNLQGSQGPIVSQPGVSIPPGQTVTVTLTFKAPATPGQYALTFSSRQYQNGAPLTGQTLQVIVLQSSLQILIPAAIGIVVAIIVLGAYLIKKAPEKGDEEVTKTRATGPKPKPPSAGNRPPKSLTRTNSLDR